MATVALPWFETPWFPRELTAVCCTLDIEKMGKYDNIYLYIPQCTSKIELVQTSVPTKIEYFYIRNQWKLCLSAKSFNTLHTEVGVKYVFLKFI